MVIMPQGKSEEISITMKEETEVLLPGNPQHTGIPNPRDSIPRGGSASQRCNLSPPRERMHFIDVLRVILTAAVITHHVILIYWMGFWPYYGQWLWSSAGSDLVPVICWTVLAFNQAYFMGLFFFISGYFACPSLNRKGSKAFIADRAKRLLIPAAVFDVILAPLSCIIAKGVNEMNVPDGLSATMNVWNWYWSAYVGVGKNPTWFILALFLFDLVYAALHSLQVASRYQGWNSLPHDDDSSEGQQEGQHGQHCHSRKESEAYSSRGLWAAMISLASGLAVLSFLIRVFFPIGSWLPSVSPGFQPAYFGQYITAYALGIFAQSSSALTRLPKSWGGRCFGVALTWFALGWFGVLLLAASNSSHGLKDPVAPMMGGAGIQALYYAVFEQGFAVVFSVGVLILGRELLSGVRRQWLAPVIGAAYYAYIIHPVIIFALTRALTSVWEVSGGAATNILAHIFVEFPLAITLTWGIAIGIKAIPGARTIL